MILSTLSVNNIKNLTAILVGGLVFVSICCNPISNCGCEAFPQRRPHYYQSIDRIDRRVQRKIMSTKMTTSERQPAPSSEREWDVQRYQDQHSFVWEYGTSLIDLLDPKCNEIIIDIGCGTGELTKSIVDRSSADSGDGDGLSCGGCTCIGIDSDISMIQRAKEQFPTDKFPTVLFQHGDISNLQLDDDIISVITKHNLNNEESEQQMQHVVQVDAIFSNAALHWVKDGPEDAVMNMSKLLKPGGRFIVEFGGKGNVQHIVDATIQAIDKFRNHDENTTTSGSVNPWYFPSIGEYSSLLERHGIEVMSAVVFDRPTPLEDGEHGLKNWLRMFGCGTSLLPDDLFLDSTDNNDNKGGKLSLEDVLQDVDDTLRPTLFNGNQWVADYRRIRIVGKKK